THLLCIRCTPNSRRCMPSRKPFRGTSRCPRCSGEGVELEGLSDYGLSDVADRDASQGHALLDTVMRVTVDHEVGSSLVDRLTEEVAAEERIDLALLRAERVLHGREVQQCDPRVGAQLGERVT